MFALPVLLLLGALQLVPLTAASTPLVACVVMRGFPYAVSGKAVAMSTVDGAAATCARLGFKYFNYAGSGTIGTCDNNEPAAPTGQTSVAYTTGTSSTTCKMGFYIPGASYDFVQCVSQPYFYAGSYTGDQFSTDKKNAYYTVQVPATGAEACMNACAAQYGKYTVWSPRDHSCVCAAAYQATPTTCSYDTYTVLSASFVIPSGLPGAQRRTLDARAAKKQLCPEGLTECAINGGFECIDPMNDLESCGGCIGMNGTDCTAIPGVSRLRVSCSEGQCTVRGCRGGHILRDGACYPYQV